jgi:dsRNA-specific ribonuclease
MQTLTRLNLDQILTTFVITLQHLNKDRDCLVSGLPKDRYKYLEFVGDRVLNLAVVLAYPASLRSESDLLITSFSEITSNSNIGIFTATQLGFKSAKPRWIADQVEAACGALWFADHFQKVQEFAKKLVSHFIHLRKPLGDPQFLRWAKQVQGRINKKAAGQYEHIWTQVDSDEEEILIKPTTSPISPTAHTTSVLLRDLKIRSGSVEEFHLTPDQVAAEQFETFLGQHSTLYNIETQFDIDYCRGVVNIVLSFVFDNIVYRAFGSGDNLEQAEIEAKSKALYRLQVNRRDLFKNESE